MPFLTQALMDRMATTAMRILPVRWERATYRARVTPSATPLEYGDLDVQFAEYSDHAIAMQGLISGDRPTVLREDRVLRVPTAQVTWTPTLYDEVLRADGSHWKVMRASGGPGHPFWLFQGRKVSGV